MKDKSFYSSVDKFTKNCWLQISISIVVIYFISNFISEMGIRGKGFTIFDFVLFNFLSNDINYLSTVNMGINAKHGISVLLSSIVFMQLYFMLNMCVLKYAQNGKFNISEALEIIKNNFLKTLIIVSIYGFLDYFISKILIVGIIIVLVLMYNLMYLPYLIFLKPELSFIDYFIESYNLACGHKFRLLKNDLYYFIRFIGIIIAGFIAGIILVIIAKSVFTFVLSYIIIIVSLLYSLFKYLPKLFCARILYFINHMDNLENNI